MAQQLLFAASAAGKLKLVAVSTPDQGPEMGEVLSQMYTTMQPQLRARCTNLWQLDGKPMSGDLGPATARAAVRLALKVLGLPGMPPGFIQLAGGTNESTFDVMEAAGIWGGSRNMQKSTAQNGAVQGSSGREESVRGGREDFIMARDPMGRGQGMEGPLQDFLVAGVAFGGSARSLVSPVLRKLDVRVEQGLSSGVAHMTGARLEEHSDLLQEALVLARRLTHPIKQLS